MRRHDSYARAVLEVLLEHFDLDGAAGTAIQRAVAAQHANPSRGGFEVIVDDPGVANWRLTATTADPSRVRLGDFRMPPLRGVLPPDPRQDIVNAALAALA